MARLQAGILSAAVGKVGGVVGFRWKDKAVLRSYAIPANPNSTDQQTQRGLFGRAVGFAKLIVGYVFNTYTDMFQKSMSGFNFFIKSNIKHFTSTIAYISLVITDGKLQPLTNYSADYDILTGKVDAAYDSDLGNNGLTTDKVDGICFDPTSGIMYFPDAASTRGTGHLIFSLPLGITARHLFVYIFAAQYYKTQVTMISRSQAWMIEA